MPQRVTAIRALFSPFLQQMPPGVRGHAPQRRQTADAMTDAPTQFVQKLSMVWSSYKEREICILVEYRKWEEQGCRMFCLSRLEELR